MARTEWVCERCGLVVAEEKPKRPSGTLEGLLSVCPRCKAAKLPEAKAAESKPRATVRERRAGVSGGRAG